MLQSGLRHYAKLSAVMRSLPILLLLSASLCAGQSKPADPPSSSDTLFVRCPPDFSTRSSLHFVGATSFAAQSDGWHAYSDVEIHDKCMYTTRLWAAPADGPLHLLYLIPPKRESFGNGMRVLGWAPGSRMVLAQTLEWQENSDAAPREGVIAIDAETGSSTSLIWNAY